ncbi:hypothetical protein GCM10027290_18390 [Micromonospora sonneratiae]|uniref:Uncharacterized protein n=1 Tax=Micromonospora sonneratiae TaxID=1184706 RepID=A0ABW3Y8D1_9ACTN
MTEGTGAWRASKVLSTGLAVVHEGEWVVAGPGSAAEAEAYVEQESATIHYHFPVEIEVVSTGQAVDPDMLVELALSRLAENLEDVA